MIRLLEAVKGVGAKGLSDLFTGAAIVVNYKGNGKWFPGKIRRFRLEGSYDIDYDDGEVEMRVPEDMIRLLDAVDGNLEVVAVLLERGADPDIPDKVHPLKIILTRLAYLNFHYICNVICT
jgi:hypothetical protein